MSAVCEHLEVLSVNKVREQIDVEDETSTSETGKQGKRVYSVQYV